MADLIRKTKAPEKSQLPYLKLARFGDRKSKRDSLRYDDNVVTVTGIEADYDGEMMPLHAAIAMLRSEGVRALVYTSPNYTEGKPRWRVLCPFSQPLKPGARRKMLGRLCAVTGDVFSRETWVLSQSYFFGSVNGNSLHQVEIIDGDFIDTRDDLDAGMPDRTERRIEIESGDERMTAELIAGVTTGAEYHTALCALAARLIGQGLKRGTAAEILRGTMLAVPEALHDARWQKRYAEIDRIVESAERNFGAEGEPPDQPDEWDAGDDDYEVPPRAWVLGNVFCKGFVSSVTSEGATGKSSLRIAQGLSVATGRELTKEHVFRQARVLIISLEDGRDELRRRVKAAMMHHKIGAADLKGWLFLAAPKGLRLAELRNGTPRIGALRGWLERALERRRPDLVIIDPFIKSHGLEENSNSAIDFVTGLLAQIAIDHDCAVDVPHHVAKGVATPGDASKARGASAFKDAARLVYSLTLMTSEEAKMFNVAEEDRRRLVRVDSAKVNIAPPSAAATWFRLVGVKLDNGSDDYPNGDEVQTVDRWHPPDVWRAMNFDTANAILDKIDAGLADGRRYSKTPQVGEARKAWRVVKVRCPDLSDGQCRTVIETWCKNGVLVEDNYDNKVARHAELGLFVVQAKRPPKTEDDARF